MLLQLGVIRSGREARGRRQSVGFMFTCHFPGCTNFRRPDAVSFNCPALTQPFFLLHSNLQVSKEGDDFPVDIEVARMSELVKGMLDGESRKCHTKTLFVMVYVERAASLLLYLNLIRPLNMHSHVIHQPNRGQRRRGGY